MNHFLQKIPIFIANKAPLKYFLSRMTEGVIPVFMLHRIEDKENGVEGTSPHEIDSFLKKIKQEGYHPIGMSELLQQLEKPHGVIKNRVAFMMDDGYIDQVTKGVPIFQKNECPVSIALITDFISGRSWPWDAKLRYLFETTNVETFSITINEVRDTYGLDNGANNLEIMREVREKFKRLPESEIIKSLKILESELKVQLPNKAPKAYQPCSWKDVVRLEGKDINFIPHTMNHYILSNLSHERAAKEIQGSIQEINKHIDALPLFVYPNGQDQDFMKEHFQFLRDSGVKCAFSTNSAYVSLNEIERKSDEILHLPRLAMPEHRCTQDKVLSKVDFISDRIRQNTLKKSFEISYGIRRAAFLKMLEVLSQYYLLKKAKTFDPIRVQRIIFVCIGNICRSPFAETVSLSTKVGIPISSMGIEASGRHQPDPVARKIAKEFDYNMDDLCSTQLKSVSLCESDLLVMMELSHQKRMNNVIKKSKCQTTLLGLWDDEPQPSLDDPYGRSDARFRFIFSHIQVSALNLMQFFQRSLH